MGGEPPGQRLAAVRAHSVCGSEEGLFKADAVNEEDPEEGEDGDAKVSPSAANRWRGGGGGKGEEEARRGPRRRRGKGEGEKGWRGRLY